MTMQSDPSMTGLNYDRIKNDAYFTIEPWVTDEAMKVMIEYGLIPENDDYSHDIWEPACGIGLMSKIIEGYGFNVFGSDITDWGNGEVGNFHDYSELEAPTIITNPPYGDDAEPFIRHALSLSPDCAAFLLRNEWDCARKRNDLFTSQDDPHFSMKIVLQKRPRWFEKKKGDAGPRHNYSWYIWSKNNDIRNRVVYIAP